ncbi:MAG: DUF4278 domain-containing protein [Leptolyngbyaceae cyanobacterium bins.302]|nr:DUF4278 domain-containing protein [Leptolyngbyaceae cyanobacterium bins.302]
MQLSYRGVKYDYHPANPVKAEYAQPNVDVKYRGATYRRSEVAKVERLGAIFKYRGTAYSQQPVTQVEAVQPVTAVANPPAVATFEDRARLLNLNHNRAVRNRHQVMVARTADEQGFSKLASYWNQIQGELDTALWADYDRSHAGLS